MTRLAIVRQRYNPAGGAERFVSRALDALARQGSLDVTLITRRWEDHAGYHSLTVNPFYLGNVWRDAGFARGVRQAIAREGFDLCRRTSASPAAMCFALATACIAPGWPDAAARCRRWAG